MRCIQRLDFRIALNRQENIVPAAAIAEHAYRNFFQRLKYLQGKALTFRNKITDNADDRLILIDFYSAKLL